jgi:hypothetical protein
VIAQSLSPHVRLKSPRFALKIFRAHFTGQLLS